MKRERLDPIELGETIFVMELSWFDCAEDYAPYPVFSEPQRPAHIKVRVCEAHRFSEGAPEFTIEGASTNMQTTTDFDKAERLFEVDVKFDGCAHWFFGTKNNAGYWHTCGNAPNGHLLAMALAYERAKAVLIKFDNWL